jgi:Ni/Co efflux regulator RcnB
MKRALTAVAAALIALTGVAGAASAQPYGHDNRDNNRGYDQQNHNDGNNRGYDQQNHNDRGNGHHNWRRGERISRNEWGQYQRVDWRRHHLRQPPRGYEWRQSNDGNYVLAAAATGLIASIIANSR